MSLAIADNRLLPALLPPFSIAAGASPFTWTNALGVRVLIVVSGGIVTAISITRLGISTSLGLTSGSLTSPPTTVSITTHGSNELLVVIADVDIAGTPSPSVSSSPSLSWTTKY